VASRTRAAADAHAAGDVRAAAEGS